MRDRIAIRGVLQEINNNVFEKRLEEPSLRTYSRIFTKIPQSIVYEDNEACLKFAAIPKMFSHTKHITIPYHFFRSKVNSLEVKVVAIDINNQKSNQFTKRLPEPKYVKDRDNLIYKWKGESRLFDVAYIVSTILCAECFMYVTSLERLISS